VQDNYKQITAVAPGQHMRNSSGHRDPWYLSHHWALASAPKAAEAMREHTSPRRVCRKPCQALCASITVVNRLCEVRRSFKLWAKTENSFDHQQKRAQLVDLFTLSSPKLYAARHPVYLVLGYPKQYRKAHSLEHPASTIFSKQTVLEPNHY